jgi:hypothetical protein
VFLKPEQQVAENIGNLAEAMRYLEHEIGMGKPPQQVRSEMALILKAAGIAGGLYLDAAEDRTQVVKALELVIEAVRCAEHLDNVAGQFSVDIAVETLLDAMEERSKEKHSFPEIFELYRQGVELMSGWMAQGRLMFGRGKTHFSAYRPGETELRRVRWMTSSSHLDNVVDLLKDSPEALKA